MLQHLEMYRKEGVWGLSCDGHLKFVCPSVYTIENDTTAPHSNAELSFSDGALRLVAPVPATLPSPPPYPRLLHSLGHPPPSGARKAAGSPIKGKIGVERYEYGLNSITSNSIVLPNQGKNA